MRVKLLVPICGPDGSFKAGDEPNLPEALAKTLVKDGHAKMIEIETLEIKADAKLEVTAEIKTAKAPMNNKAKSQRR